MRQAMTTRTGGRADRMAVAVLRWSGAGLAVAGPVAALAAALWAGWIWAALAIGLAAAGVLSWALAAVAAAVLDLAAGARALADDPRLG